MRAARTVRLAGVVLTLAGLGAGAVSATAALRPDGHRTVVLVSGRDDHGLVELPDVPLSTTAEGGTVAGTVPDGTPAAVLDVRGTWLRVRAAGVTGWVDDYRLRGTVHLVGPPPGCAVTLEGVRVEPGAQAGLVAVAGDSVRVRLLDGTGRAGVVPAGQVRETAPSAQEPCGATAPAPADGHHH